jgi:GTP-binding protein|tara:strand:+ start:4795 stop:6207 length:1413 start_codon:yes stop_codon:yes gene_type:complete
LKAPVIAIVGRPNVGKSTLFNRLTRSRDALVADYSGLTRDRKYGRALIDGHPFLVIDTGGLTGGEAGVEAAMAGQSKAAIEEADAVMFMVDVIGGITASDVAVSEMLRRVDKPVWLVANKIDGQNPDVVLSEFYGLGFGEPYPIAASHGRGVSALSDIMLTHFGLQDVDPEEEGAERSDAPGIRIGVIGRPNVGKSTLVNRMLGEDRVVVFDLPGTTRDSIYIPYERHGEMFTLIDTAGVRRRGRVSETVEKFSIVKTLQAVEDAQVVILVIDAQEGLVEQDLHLIGMVVDAGRALVVAINKWDHLLPDDRDRVRVSLDRRLNFIPWAKQHFISALHGTGVGDLYRSIRDAHGAATTKFATNALTKILEDAVLDHQPPLVRGRRIKLRYAHQGGMNPPRIIVHGNQTKDVPESYRRYLENTFRKALKISGTPIKVDFKAGENPFAGRRNQLTDRQIQRKRRLMQFVKQKK